MSKSPTHYILITYFLLLVQCSPSSKDQSTDKDKESTLKDALTFFAGFDGNHEAAFAKGDKNMYTAPSRKKLDSSVVGMQYPKHTLSDDDGKVGGSLSFGDKTDTVVYYKAKNNLSYSTDGWTGSMSLWLKLNPAEDLEPGYTDPIQITDVNYNDASIWLDFTQENPRDFRLGVFGDLTEWSKDTVETSQEEEFERRLVRVKKPPFTSTDWTHIVVNYERLGTPESKASLYVNAKKIGDVQGIDDPFTWDLDKANIYLGLNFIGMMDELSFFDRPLTTEEINTLQEGIGTILN